MITSRRLFFSTSERPQIAHRGGGGAVEIFIAPHGAGLGVGDDDLVADVGRHGGLHPKMTVQATAVDDLDEELPITRSEELEEGRLAGACELSGVEARRVSAPPIADQVRPFDVDAKASAPSQAERRFSVAAVSFRAARSARLGAGGKGQGVDDRRQRLARSAAIGPPRAARRVGDRDRVIGRARGTEEYPMVTVGGRAVEHLEQQFPTLGCEEFDHRRVA